MTESRPPLTGNGGLGKEPGEEWREIDKDSTVGRYLFHYTRLSAALEGILPKLQLRFSRFSSMRDPRESKWAFATVFMGEVPQADQLTGTLWSTLHRAREDVRILSLTADDPRPRNQLYGRGFARPRLWEHYAGNHVGVCLCLERSALERSVAEAIEGIGAKLVHAPVNYRDGEIALHASHFDLNQAQQRNPVEVIHDHMAKHAEELFFTKLTDWATESEYRFMTVWQGTEELYVDISKALYLVILGFQVAREYAPSFYALCEPRGIPVAKVEWTNGRPLIFRAAPGPKLE